MSTPASSPPPPSVTSHSDISTKYSSYLTSTKPRDWDMVEYVNYCVEQASQFGFRFDLNACMNSWQKELRQFSKDNIKDEAASRRATSLLGRFAQQITHGGQFSCMKNLYISTTPVDMETVFYQLGRCLNPKLPTRRLGQYFDAVYQGVRGDRARAKSRWRSIQRAQAPGKIIIHKPRFGRTYGSVYSAVKMNFKGQKSDAVAQAKPNPPEPEGEESADDDISTTSTPPPNLSALDPANILPLRGGTHVEAVVSKYGKSIKETDLTHWGIIDSSDQELMKILERLGFWALVSGDMELSRGGQSLGLDPLRVPPWLTDYMKRYDNVRDMDAYDRVRDEASLSISQDESASDVAFLKRWVDRCYEHVLSLLIETGDLLHQKLCEGVWESIYWYILDVSFGNLFDLMIQRRDIRLNAMVTEEHPVVTVMHRFDGIIRTRELPRISRALEFGVIEVSRAYEGECATKWNNDMAKLYVACRSILNDLKDAVNRDPATMTQLAAVGILHAGPRTSVLVMRCLGPNLSFLRRGGNWQLPMRPDEYSSLSDVMCAIWHARKYVQNTYNAVLHYRRNHPDYRSASTIHDPTSL